MKYCRFCSDKSLKFIPDYESNKLPLINMDYLPSGYWRICAETYDDVNSFFIHYCPFCGRNLFDDIKYKDKNIGNVYDWMV